MDEGSHESVSQRTVASDGGNSSIFEDVATLIDDGRTLVEAELAFQKTRIAYAGIRGRNAAIFGIVALALAVLAVFALIVGALLALAPLLGAWGATAVVAGILLAVAALCAVLALRNAKLISKAFRDEG